MNEGLNSPEVTSSQSGPQQGVITVGTLDLTGHADDCELRGAATPICTAMAMDPNRKIWFTCTCGEYARRHQVVNRKRSSGKKLRR